MKVSINMHSKASSSVAQARHSAYCAFNIVFLQLKWCIKVVCNMVTQCQRYLASKGNLHGWTCLAGRRMLSSA